MSANRNSLRAGSLWMIAGQGASLLLQAIYFILIGRALGSREYGAFVGVVALVNVIGQFTGLGMDMVLLRNVSRDPESFAGTWGRALVITFSGFPLLLVVAMGLSFWFLRPELRWIVPFIALSDGLMGKLVQLAGRAFQAMGRMAVASAFPAILSFGRVGAAVAFLVFIRRHGLRPSALGWAHFYWVATAATAVPALVVTTLCFGWPRLTRLVQGELSEGLSFSISSSSITTFNDIDKTFLVGMGGLSAAGIYAAAYRVLDVASMPIYSAFAAATPDFFREGRHGVARAAPLTRKLLRCTVPYGVVLSIALYCGAGLMPRVFGPSFAGSAAVLRWLCPLPLIRALHYTWGTTITATASQWNRTWTQLGAALLNIGLNIALIPRWSWRGAAVATLLTDGALALSNWLLLKKIARRERERALAATMV